MQTSKNILNGQKSDN